jgi:uncharacterized protein YbbC (DUF1343 family)
VIRLKEVLQIVIPAYAGILRTAQEKDSFIRRNDILELIKPFLIIFFFTIFITISSGQEINRPKVKLGIDVLQDSNFKAITNKKIALLTNSTGRNSTGITTVEILANQPNVELKAVLTPEHGYYTNIPAGLAVENDSINSIPVISLYGAANSPDKNFISSIDAIVVDVQDIGVRSYTYLSSVYKTMEAAARNNKEIIILDRPNPLGGLIVDGNMLDSGMSSFVGIISVAYIHGLTLGEIAMMINKEGWLKDVSGKSIECNLKIIKMSGWKRWMLWEDTGLLWYPTSPHVPTVNAIRGLATLGIFGELGFLSIGIGTTSPFQYIGEKSFKIKDLQNITSTIIDSGLDLSLTKFRPFYGMYSSNDINGFYLQFPLSNQFKPYSSGIDLILKIREYYPKVFDKSKIDSKAKEMFTKVTGSKLLFDAIFDFMPEDQIHIIANKGFQDFLNLRNKYLLYD